MPMKYRIQAREDGKWIDLVKSDRAATITRIWCAIYNHHRSWDTRLQQRVNLRWKTIERHTQ